jgi:hypothetical protein
MTQAHGYTSMAHLDSGRVLLHHTHTSLKESRRQTPGQLTLIKWLNVPYDSGIAFVRDADTLQAAMANTAEYLPTATDHCNPSDFTPELSRRGRGVEV